MKHDVRPPGIVKNAIYLVFDIDVRALSIGLLLANRVRSTNSWLQQAGNLFLK